MTGKNRLKNIFAILFCTAVMCHFGTCSAYAKVLPKAEDIKKDTTASEFLDWCTEADQYGSESNPQSFSKEANAFKEAVEDSGILDEVDSVNNYESGVKLIVETLTDKYGLGTEANIWACDFEDKYLLYRGEEGEDTGAETEKELTTVSKAAETINVLTWEGGTGLSKGSISALLKAVSMLTTKSGSKKLMSVMATLGMSMCVTFCLILVCRTPSGQMSPDHMIGFAIDGYQQSI